MKAADLIDKLECILMGIENDIIGEKIFGIDNKASHQISTLIEDIKEKLDMIDFNTSKSN